MALTYTWKITGLKTRDEGGKTDAVVQTYWQKIGTDSDGNEGTFSGATPFTINETDSTDFIPFNELTESTAIEWIKQVVIGSYEEHVNEQIQRQIDEKKSNIRESSLPWATPEGNLTPPDSV
jgi:hypothetical protein